MCVCVIHHGLEYHAITLTESSQLIIVQSMCKAVTFQIHSILLLKEDSNCLVINETLHLIEVRTRAYRVTV